MQRATFQPNPAAPAYEPPPPALSLNDSGRRILWIVGLYRAICGAVLLGTAFLLDLKILGIAAPNTFLLASGIYFAFGLVTFWWIQREPLPLPAPPLVSSLLAGDVICIAIVMLAGGGTGGSLPILLFPQLAASGWLLRTRTAFFHAALATFVLLGLDLWRLVEGQIGGAQPFQTGLIGFGFFATVGIAVALGRYTQASEDLAAQRGIDVANLEQVNRLIIQDMQDGVLVVDLNGVVRGHNAQVTRLLGGFGRMRGGMRLAEFSSTLHDYWRRWHEDYTEALPPFKVEPTQRLLRVRLVRIGSGLNGGTLIYLEDLGRAQTEAQQMKLAAMGRLTASIAHEVRNPLSAINQAAQLLEEDNAVVPGGQRLLAMIRNNAKRIDRIVGEVLQLNRRDRQQPEAIALAEFMQSLVDEIVQAESIPAGAVVILIAEE
ncbi:MAG: histidine kinase dimerization/phospho-acceptor domain-containing protein, partial [Betaproteobacteria bacterium]